jgi:hypothetical protein
MGRIEARYLGQRAALQDDAQRVALAHERDRARPRRQRVDRLGEREADHRADRVSRTAGPARSLNLGDERRDLGRG